MPSEPYTLAVTHRFGARVKIAEFHDIVSTGEFVRSREWSRAWTDVKAAIRATDWPHGSGKFTIYPESGKKRGKGNGVKPIKIPCVAMLERRGWTVECVPPIERGILGAGDLDALLELPTGCIAFEWETGNVSSSHRAINKLLLAMVRRSLLAGFLVVPSAKLAQYLTDRIGNVGELRHYFQLWGKIPIRRGALRIVAVEQDAESRRVRRIPKGTDGRSLG